MDNFEVHIGLEIHVQLLAKSKMFCSCPAKFGEDANTNVCPVCLGFPGMLPVPNMEALAYAYRIAKALNCQLAPIMQFDRKNYYYPDLPKNYQITQFYYPVGVDGTFAYELQGELKSLAITQAHLEEDAGKLIHTSDASLCDYNRSGTPLMEVVTQPEIHSPEEAEILLKQFRRMVRYMGVCDGNMEEGSMRCDANISINHVGKGLGSKVEIKNVNSFRFVRIALEFEIARQSKLLAEGKGIVQETRLWNENRDITESMRTKEHADDYRYIPDPDIIPYKIPQAFFDEVSRAMVELPLDRRTRLQNTFALEGKLLDFFTEEKAYADFFEATIAEGASPRLVATWVPSDVQKLLNRGDSRGASRGESSGEGAKTSVSIEKSMQADRVAGESVGNYTGNYTIDNSPISPARLGRVLVLLEEAKLHGKLAKRLLELIFAEDRDPDELIEAYQLKALDAAELAAIVDKVLAAQSDAVAQYKVGDKKPVGFLIGKIMTESGGRAEPQAVQLALMNALNA